MPEKANFDTSNSEFEWMDENDKKFIEYLDETFENEHFQLNEEDEEFFTEIDQIMDKSIEIKNEINRRNELVDMMSLTEKQHEYLFILEELFKGADSQSSVIGQTKKHLHQLELEERTNTDEYVALMAFLILYTGKIT